VLCWTPFWSTFIVNHIQPYNLQGAKKVNLKLQHRIAEKTSARSHSAPAHLCIRVCVTHTQAHARSRAHRHGACVTHTSAVLCVSLCVCVCVRARTCVSHTEAYTRAHKCEGGYVKCGCKTHSRYPNYNSYINDFSTCFRKTWSCGYEVGSIVTSNRGRKMLSRRF
jgi:hypothetical protein